MVATEAAEDIKESDREATDLGWGLKGARLPFIWLFQNIATMKGTGKNRTLCSPPLNLTSQLVTQINHGLLVVIIPFAEVLHVYILAN